VLSLCEKVLAIEPYNTKALTYKGEALGALSFTMSKEVQKTNFPELPVKKVKFCTVHSYIQIKIL
jgi:hypothetical protein